MAASKLNEHLDNMLQQAPNGNQKFMLTYHTRQRSVSEFLRRGG